MPKPAKLADETVAPTRQQWEENAYGFYLFITEGKLSNQKSHLENFKVECPPDIYEQKVMAQLNPNARTSSPPQQPPMAGPLTYQFPLAWCEFFSSAAVNPFACLPASPRSSTSLHPSPSQPPRPSNAEMPGPIHEIHFSTPHNPHDFGLAREPLATPTPWHGHAQPSLLLEQLNLHETTAWAIRPASSLPEVQKYGGDLLGFERLEHVDEELAEILLKAWPDHFSVDKLRLKELGNALVNMPYVVDEFSALAIEMWVRKDAWDITFMDMGQWLRLVLRGSETPGWTQLKSFDMICGGMDFILDPL
ncbi:hypothetical protein IMY05_C4635000800 [Salix suchowensis]|nr:hypothetical protein IMY05_C4635000800 [Salix suchowensis]